MGLEFSSNLIKIWSFFFIYSPSFLGFSVNMYIILHIAEGRLIFSQSFSFYALFWIVFIVIGCNSLFIFFLRIIIHFFHFPCCLRVFYFIRFYGFAALAGALFKMSLVKKTKEKFNSNKLKHEENLWTHVTQMGETGIVLGISDD